MSIKTKWHRIDGLWYLAEYKNSFNRRLYSFDSGRSWDTYPLYAFRAAKDRPKGYEEKPDEQESVPKTGVKV